MIEKIIRMLDDMTEEELVIIAEQARIQAEEIKRNRRTVEIAKEISDLFTELNNLGVSVYFKGDVRLIGNVDFDCDGDITLD